MGLVDSKRETGVDVDEVVVDEFIGELERGASPSIYSFLRRRNPSLRKNEKPARKSSAKACFYQQLVMRVNGSCVIYL